MPYIFIRVDANTKSLINQALDKINKRNPDLKETAQNVGEKMFLKWARKVINN